MTLEEAGTWTGNIAELGPIYPWVGAETAMVIVLLVVWVGWHIWQISLEESNYSDDLRTLQREGNMDRALRGERILRSM